LARENQITRVESSISTQTTANVEEKKKKEKKKQEARRETTRHVLKLIDAGS
jgi:hypothetical protein